MAEGNESTGASLQFGPLSLLAVFCLGCLVATIYLKLQGGAKDGGSAGSHFADRRNSTSKKIADPLNWSFVPTTGHMKANLQKLDESENQWAKIRVFAMSRPTHDPNHSKSSKDYPSAWHMAGKKRIWEFRCHIIFKEKPTGDIYFGIQAGEFSPVSASTKLLQRTLLTACSKVLGGKLYHSAGDNPKKTVGEIEPPCLALPLWAVDQFIVSDIGKEPDILGNIQGMGWTRTDGLKEYIEAMKRMIAEISTDKVYTFGIWGTSQFADCNTWKIQAFGMCKDLEVVTGPPPINVMIYSLAGVDKRDRDQRHLTSRKKTYANFAIWSDLAPPDPDRLQDVIGELPSAKDGAPRKERSRKPARPRANSDNTPCDNKKMLCKVGKICGTPKAKMG